MNTRKRKDIVFLKTGFKNCKKALEKFQQHEQSEHHRLAQINANITSNNGPVIAQFSHQIQKPQEEAKSALHKIISSLRFLAQCGLAVRGHTKESGNLYHLLKLRGEEDSSLEKWLVKKINYTSPAIQIYLERGC